MSTYTFKTKNGIELGGFSPASLSAMHQDLAELGIEPTQIAEAASYSMAMVVRYALGLSATGGKVCALVGDSLAGAVALATMRHLVNAGADGSALLVFDPTIAGPETKRQLTPLSHMGVPIEWCRESHTGSAAHAIISASHNVIFGLFGLSLADPVIAGCVTMLNEQQTPVHAIEAPLGVDLENGAHGPAALFASSTLSLGAPYAGLNPGRDCVGRHYLCDISITREIYAKHGEDLSALFAQQPVTQILPVG